MVYIYIHTLDYTYIYIWWSSPWAPDQASVFGPAAVGTQIGGYVPPKARGWDEIFGLFLVDIFSTYIYIYVYLYIYIYVYLYLYLYLYYIYTDII